MEEERARQEAAAKRAAEEASRQDKGGEPSSESRDATMTESAALTAADGDSKKNDQMVCTLSIKHSSNRSLVIDNLSR